MKELSARVGLSAYGGLMAVGAAVALNMLLQIPADPKNSVLWGFSMQRLVLLAILLLGALSGLALAGWALRRTVQAESRLKGLWKSSFGVPALFALAAAAAGIGWAFSWWSWDDFRSLSAYLMRLRPLFVWLSWVGLLTGCLLLIFGRQYAPKRIWGLFHSQNQAHILGAIGLLVLGGLAAVAVGPLGLALRYDFGRVLFPLALVLLAAFTARGPWGRRAGLVVTLLVFVLPLLGMWAKGESEQYIVLGMFPLKDPHGYYYGARHLLENGVLSDFSGRRPLFPGFLAGLLRLTGENLQITLLLVVLLASLACYLTAREVSRTHGPLGGAAAAFLLFLFYRQYTGTTLTENLGLACGAGGFALLWSGAAQRQPRRIFAGILLVSLGLNARAGAFFVLPALVVWAAWQGKEKRWSWIMLAGGVLAAALGFVCNSLAFRLFSPPDSSLFSNFSYTLYGLVVGGKGWGQIWMDHPEVTALAEPLLSQRIYALTWQAFLQNPSGIVLGAFKAWGDFFSVGSLGMFGFIGRTNATANLIGALAGYFFSAAAVVLGWRKRDTLWWLLAAAMLGVLASVPFVPTVDAGLRTYAVVMPLFAVLPACGMALLIHRPDQQVVPAAAGSRAAPIFAAVLVFLMLAGPLWAKATVQPARYREITCPAGTQAVYLRLRSGSAVNILPDESLARTWVPQIRYSDFTRSIHDFEYSEIMEELSRVTPPATVAVTHDLKTGEFVWLMVDTGLLPPQPQVLGVCGRWTTDARTRDMGFFFAQQVEEVSISAGN